MRVGIDVQPLVGTGGIATYTRGLLEHLSGIDVVPIFGGLRGLGAVCDRLPAHLAGGLHVLPLATRALARVARLAGSRGGEAIWPVCDLDLVHATNYLAPPVRAPLVVTVHDLSVFRNPRWHPAEVRRQQKLLPAEVRAARLVIAVSECTARDVEDLLGVPRSRIRVVPLAPTPLPAPAPRTLADRGLAADPYVLFVGAIEPRKNLVRLIRAFLGCPEARGHRLVLAGPLAWGEAEVRAAAAADPRILLTGPVSPAELAALYQGAACFAYPSLYEGFGLPPLEAMAAGVPVLASDRGSLPEVLGDAAVLVNPEDDGAMARGLGEILGDPGAAAKLRRLGFARASRYSWEVTAELTRSAYEDALS